MRRTCRLALPVLLLAGCIDLDKPSDFGEAWTGDSDFSEAVAGENMPAHFDDPVMAGLDNTPSDNPFTDEGATLGRALFYDPRLSANETVSCASCHQQQFAFSDPEVLSVGFDGGHTGRHGMPLVNVRWYAPGAMFWDERADTLEEQVLMPIQDEVEMGLTLTELVETVEAIDAYRPLFLEAYGDEMVSSERISNALAQFVRALVSTSSPYDDGLEAARDVRREFSNLSADENAGKDIFFGAGGCAACHTSGGGPGNQTAVFYIDRAVNNGLDAVTTDAGVGGVTGRARDEGLFKSPSLRNVAVTGPYMHDGRFDTLEEVVDHYRFSVQPHPNLDPRLGRNGARNMSDREADQLVAFLETLTDDDFLTDARYNNPWDVQ